MRPGRPWTCARRWPCSWSATPAASPGAGWRSPRRGAAPGCGQVVHLRWNLVAGRWNRVEALQPGRKALEPGRKSVPSGRKALEADRQDPADTVEGLVVTEAWISQISGYDDRGGTPPGYTDRRRPPV